MTLHEVRMTLMRIRDIFDLSVGAYALLTEEPARSELSQYTIRYNEVGEFQATKSEPRPVGGASSYQISFRDTDYRVAAKALVERTQRQAIIESLALVRDFSKGTAIWDKLNSEPWFNFALLYRNAVAHNGRWLLVEQKDLNRLPVTWCSFTIDRSLNEKNIDGCINLWEARQLLARMETYLIDQHR